MFGEQNGLNASLFYCTQRYSFHCNISLALSKIHDESLLYMPRFKLALLHLKSMYETSVKRMDI